MSLTIDQANQKLNAIKIRAKANKLYLRGTLPPLPEHDRPKQEDIVTGLYHTPEGIKAA